MDVLNQDEQLDATTGQSSQDVETAAPTNAYNESWDDDQFDEDLLDDDELLADDELTDEEEMTIVDPLIDKAAQQADDLDLEDDLDDSEFDDDIQLDELDEFMADDPEKADDLLVLDDAGMGDDDLDPLLDKELQEAPLTASQQALEARRAIEERAERRRMERDLNYLDFELDD